MQSEVSNSAQRRRLVGTGSATYTSRRIDGIVGRFYSIALLLATLEISVNALEQRPYVSQLGFWLIFGGYLAATLTLIVVNWFFEIKNRYYLIHALVILVCVVVWPLAVPHPENLPPDFTPFIWWMTGWGGLSAGLCLNQYLAPAYIVVLPVAFALVERDPSGGSASVQTAVQNGVYTFLISSVITGVVWFLRWRARQQDIASEVAAETAASQAAESAVDAERLRIASIVHNQVLSALNAAATAHSAGEYSTAASLAESAIDRLKAYDAIDSDQPTAVPVDAFFSALGDLVSGQSQNISVAVNVEGKMFIPIEVANALTEATLQAVTNSLIHAGAGTKLRRVSMRASKGWLKITIVDDGKGFWVNRVPKNRLGLQMIIIRRVTEVGATPKIQSRPGEGTTIVLEWGTDD